MCIIKIIVGVETERLMWGVFHLFVLDMYYTHTTTLHLFSTYDPFCRGHE